MNIPAEGGVLEQQDYPWQYDTVVDPSRTKQLGEPYENAKGGTLFSEVVYMSDGVPYEVVTGVPEEPVTDIGVILTTAWFTSIKGHNTHTTLKLMQMGYPVTLIGPEGGHFDPSIGPIEKIKHLKQIELARTAHNMHEILSHTQPRFDQDPENCVALGESRGAMVGKGFVASDRLHGRNVLYADFVAPCFAKEVSISQLIEYRDQLPHELASLAHLAGKTSLRRLIHYPSTLNVNPNALAHALATIPTLISGQAGNMARHTDQDQNMHITGFQGDHAGQIEEWEDIFSAHGGVRVARESGSHVTIANNQTLGKMVSRLSGLAEQLHEGAPIEEIDFSYVHLTPLEEAA
jgi:hypothetical protein